MTGELQEIALRLGVAALAGLAVGVEREWSKSLPDATARFAGVRTFLLIGLTGGMATVLSTQALFVGVVLLSGAALLVAVAYASHASHDIDATTEVAAFVVLGAGALAGTGQLALASGIAATTVLVLAEKGRVHGAIHAIRSEELAAGARFAVLALVVLPLLPEGPFGPAPGFKPRELWALVLLFSGLSFAGLVAVRLAGAERGYAVAGALGGIVSSTAVTLNFSRQSRETPDASVPLALGAVSACAVLNVRVLVLSTVLAAPVGLAAVKYLALPTVLGALIAVFAFRNKKKAKLKVPANPLRLKTAILLAVGFQIAVTALAWVRELFGSVGMLASAAALGFTDMDALIYSMAKLGGGEAAALAGRALAVGLISNTVLKLGIALTLGSPAFKRIAALGLIVLGAATAAGLFVFD